VSYESYDMIHPEKYINHKPTIRSTMVYNEKQNDETNDVCGSQDDSKYNFKTTNNQSFILSTKRNFFSTKTIMSSEKTRNCKTCNLSYPYSEYKYCSFHCYKKSKIDQNGIYHLICLVCKKKFNTMCIFTDYCSDECFNKLSVV